VQQHKSRSGLLKYGFVVGLVTGFALVPGAWAYVNGGDFHSTLRDFEKQLKARGWVVNVAVPVPGDNGGHVAQGVKVTPPDNAAYQRYVNLLVGRALQALPAKEAEQISAEAKREVVRLTRETIREAVSKKRHIIREGQKGFLQYQVGAFQFESYWETNYGGKREIHEKRSGLSPIVALKVVKAKGLAKQRP
jgi:hypothetical protein